MNFYFTIIIRLLLSCILGGLIGIEREINNRPAGLRTHILVTVGSTLVMLISMYGFTYGDPSRLAAQVISGIGFLGAGTIIRNGSDISGLTTAASIWVSGGIGLAIGNGFYFGACFATGIVLFSLFSLGFIEKKMFRNNLKKVNIQCIDRKGLVGELGLLFSEYNISIKELKLSNTKSNDSGKIMIRLALKLPKDFDIKILEYELYKIKGIEKIIC
ncbi:putative Mg(2+) transport ATPase [Clostridium tepidiprofundi DSM 19306]|uniref:Putative Mg(2+) transport ATPase n=1 Tax=Clostridium tepidiprofundi DSM 19306 TaxID=1121338 RepID=A0A151B7U5_9CLOT|nr:MgtC/SapB family protein [Clostridium tepidiprofundi]KYH36008.1 putative Mg(2+) transport ATPase [Clostridium tepidiprofundi DSM 19306]